MSISPTRSDNNHTIPTYPPNGAWPYLSSAFITPSNNTMLCNTATHATRRNGVRFGVSFREDIGIVDTVLRELKVLRS
jgi:hypothetical protein